MNYFEDIERQSLYVGDTVALHYRGYIISGEITSFTKHRVRVRAPKGTRYYWSGWNFLKRSDRLLKIKK